MKSCLYHPSNQKTGGPDGPTGSLLFTCKGFHALLTVGAFFYKER